MTGQTPEEKTLQFYRDQMHIKYGGKVGYGLDFDYSHTWSMMTDQEVLFYRHVEEMVDGE